MKKKKEKGRAGRVNVAVFFGGRSNEREISVITGMYCTNLLRGSPFRVFPVWLPASGGMKYAKGARSVAEFAEEKGEAFVSVALSRGALVRADNPKKTVARIDCALNCCHGGMGEDGTLSALFAWHGIANASPPMPASAVFMDKALTKIAAKGLGIPVARSFFVEGKRWEENRAEVLAEAAEFGYPIVVKPLRLGSSIGVSVARDEAELASAFSLAFSLDGGALAEEYFPDRRELDCAAYRRKEEIVFSAIEEVFPRESVFSFGEKYEGGIRAPQIPAELSAEREAELRACLSSLYSAFGLRGVVRADFLLVRGREGERLLLSELNTVPGSLACHLFGRTLAEARAFLITLVEEGLRPEPAREIVTTGILGNPIFSGVKGCKNGGIPL